MHQLKKVPRSREQFALSKVDLKFVTNLHQTNRTNRSDMVCKSRIYHKFLAPKVSLRKGEKKNSDFFAVRASGLEIRDPTHYYLKFHGFSWFYPEFARFADLPASKIFFEDSGRGELLKIAPGVDIDEKIDDFFFRFLSPN